MHAKSVLHFLRLRARFSTFCENARVHYMTRPMKLKRDVSFLYEKGYSEGLKWRGGRTVCNSLGNGVSGILFAKWRFFFMDFNGFSFIFTKKFGPTKVLPFNCFEIYGMASFWHVNLSRNATFQGFIFSVFVWNALNWAHFKFWKLRFLYEITIFAWS